MKWIRQKRKGATIKVYALGVQIFHYKAPVELPPKPQPEQTPRPRQTWGLPAQQGACIVVGNGPSVAAFFRHHRHSLGKHTKICVNYAFQNPLYFEMKPQIHVFMDPAFWDLQRMAGRKELIRELERVDWPLSIVLPERARGKSCFEKWVRNKNITYCFINTTYRDENTAATDAVFEAWRVNDSMPRVENVITAALYVAVQLAFEKIYMIGVETNQFSYVVVQDDNTVCQRPPHFYDASPPLAPMTYGGRPMRMSILCHQLHWVFRGYEELQQYATYSRAEIVNLTSGSYIDAFRKEDFRKIAL